MTEFVQTSPCVNAIALFEIGPSGLMRPNQLFSMTRPVLVGSLEQSPLPVPDASIPKTSQFQMRFPSIVTLSLCQGAMQVVCCWVIVQSWKLLWYMSTWLLLPSTLAGSSQGWDALGVTSDQHGPQSEFSIVRCCTLLK